MLSYTIVSLQLFVSTLVKEISCFNMEKSDPYFFFYSQIWNGSAESPDLNLV